MKKKLLLLAQAEVDINKINKGGNKKNNNKGGKALGKNSDGTTSIDIVWDPDGPDMRVDRLQQEFD